MNVIIYLVLCVVHGLLIGSLTERWDWKSVCIAFMPTLTYVIGATS